MCPQQCMQQGVLVRLITVWGFFWFGVSSVLFRIAACSAVKCVQQSADLVAPLCMLSLSAVR